MKELMVTQQIVSQALEPVFKNWISLIETNNRRDIELARINADLKKTLTSIILRSKDKRHTILNCQNFMIQAINNSSLSDHIKALAISQGYRAIVEIAGL